MSRTIAEQCAARGVKVPLFETAGALRAKGFEIPEAVPDSAMLRPELTQEAVDLGGRAAKTGYVWDLSMGALCGHRTANALPPDPAEYPILPVDTPSKIGRTFTRKAVEAAIDEYKRRYPTSEGDAHFGFGSYFRATEDADAEVVPLHTIAFYTTELALRQDGEGTEYLAARIQPFGPRGQELVARLPDGARALVSLYAANGDPVDSFQIRRIDFRELP